MASTFRQIVNNVLTNIGSTNNLITGTVGSTVVSDNYVLQVCNFVNHFKEEVEAAGQWSALWQTFNINYLSGNTQQQITDMNVAGKSPNSQSRIVRMFNRRFAREVALCFNVTTFGIPFLVGEMPLADIIYYNTVLNQTPVAYSTNFAIQDAGQDNMQLYMYPGANANFLIQLTMVVPQPRIDPTVAGQAGQPWASTSWTGSTVGLDSPILVPYQPIEIAATWWALEERGEEMGASALFTEERYRNALDAYVSKDLGEQGGIEMLIG